MGGKEESNRGGFKGSIIRKVVNLRNELGVVVIGLVCLG